MKIVAFVGSPHRDGNTAWVVGEIARVAKARGAEVEIFHAWAMNVKTCMGCRACMNKKGCVIKDDMGAFFEAFRAADAFVFATPNYMGQMSGQAKTFFDRMSPYVVPKFSPKFNPEYADKKLVLVFTQGNPDKGKFKAYYDYTREMFEMLSFDVQGIIVAAGTREKGASANTEIVGEIENVVQKLFAGVN
jgi:multimeric flavodoxin WrbA